MRKRLLKQTPQSEENDNLLTLTYDDRNGMDRNVINDNEPSIVVSNNNNDYGSESYDGNGNELSSIVPNDNVSTENYNGNTVSYNGLSIISNNNLSTRSDIGSGSYDRMDLNVNGSSLSNVSNDNNNNYYYFQQQQQQQINALIVSLNEYKQDKQYEINTLRNKLKFLQNNQSEILRNNNNIINFNEIQIAANPLESVLSSSHSTLNYLGQDAIERLCNLLKLGQNEIVLYKMSRKSGKIIHLLYMSQAISTFHWMI